ncbi:FGGY-family carbohydrate kinase, partial [Brucella melitensis]|uniref:FGGY-family carbohydrate kinase n=1 Tax=Brucella melitensis TaxID=29459 RepID=UPI001FD44BC9
VASAARHDYRCGEAPFGGKLGAQTSRSLAPLDQLRHLPFAQAVLEGVAFAIRDNLLALQSAGTEITSLTAVGGGSRSTYWL